MLDKMTASDVTYSIICYENRIDIWIERFKMKQMNDVEKDYFERTVTLKYHCHLGTKLKAYQDGWIADGLQY